jgi:hypothetical protein
MNYLLEKTSFDDAYWMARVQQLIVECSTPIATESREENGQIVALAGHSSTDTKMALRRLLDEVIATNPISGSATGIGVYDENMRTISLLGYICVLWYSSTHRAKLFDPARPLSLRRQAWGAYLSWATELVRMLLDVSRLSTFFPIQKWGYPFDPEGKDGTFI